MWWSKQQPTKSLPVEEDVPLTDSVIDAVFEFGVEPFLRSVLSPELLKQGVEEGLKATGGQLYSFSVSDWSAAPAVNGDGAAKQEADNQGAILTGAQSPDIAQPLQHRRVAKYQMTTPQMYGFTSDIEKVQDVKDVHDGGDGAVSVTNRNLTFSDVDNFIMKLPGLSRMRVIEVAAVWDVQQDSPTSCHVHVRSGVRVMSGVPFARWIAGQSLDPVKAAVHKKLEAIAAEARQSSSGGSAST